MASAVDDKYLAPKEQPVFLLNAEKSFNGLTEKEKLYAHYISHACWEGSLICLYQTSPESPALFSIFQRLFHGNSIDELRSLAEKKGVTADEFKDLLQFAGAFYGNLGNYLSFGDTKFIPRISQDKFQAVLESSTGPEDLKNEMLSLWASNKDRIYSLKQNELSLGLEDQGISTYYSDNITRKDIEIVRRFMQSKSISAYNTRLWKLSETEFELKKASSVTSGKESHQFEGVTIHITTGDHSPFLSQTVANLQKALPYAANSNQQDMLNHYIRSFSSGSIDAHKDAQRSWIKDIQPVVETNIGFIESYRDPEGERGEWEGFVAVVNKEMSAKFSNLVTKAQDYIPHLPWGKDFEKDRFLKPDFTSLEVVSFASSGIPAGINIPNYDDIRQSEGFKNVSLGNVLAAKSKEPVDYVSEQDRELYEKYETESFEVQVGIHELLGHGTGKLLMVDEKGQKNFPEGLKNPLTGKNIESWYKPGETWDSKFQSFASTMEECRAELTGLYLCTNKDLLSIFGYHGQEAEDIFYINWLIMVRAGLRALEFYTPATQKWGQAHMQARYSILKALLAAGQDFVKIHQEKDNVYITIDRSKIMTVGMPAVSDFLQKLQIYKSTADVENGIKYYQGFCSVTAEHVALRDLVLAKKKPRRVFVQPLTFMENNEVKYLNFDATVDGLIQSFVKRFPAKI